MGRQAKEEGVYVNGTADSLCWAAETDTACCSDQACAGRVRLFVTPRTVAHQAPLSMGFSTQEYWSGLPFPTPGDLLDPGIKLGSLASPGLAGGFFTTH